MNLGQYFTYAAWALALLLFSLLFSNLLQNDPNRNIVISDTAPESWRVVLKRNRDGHYLLAGTINEIPVTFMLDTGATLVSIPQALAKPLALTLGRSSIAHTAGGDTPVFATHIEHLEFAGLHLRNLRAMLIPDMTGEQVLLGMDVLKRFELLQQGDTLTLRLPQAKEK